MTQITAAPAPKLALLQPIINQHAIELLEMALEQVRSGEVQHIAFALQTANGLTTTAYSKGEHHAFTMLGALEYLKMRYAQEQIVTDRE